PGAWCALRAVPAPRTGDRRWAPWDRAAQRAGAPVGAAVVHGISSVVQPWRYRSPSPRVAVYAGAPRYVRGPGASGRREKLLGVAPGARIGAVRPQHPAELRDHLAALQSFHGGPCHAAGGPLL